MVCVVFFFHCRHHRRCLHSNWLDFEVKSDKREHQALQILYQIVETTQTFWIFGLIDID